MEAVKATSNRIHPLVAAASVSVILASMVGVAAMTGILPNSHGSAAPTTAAVPAPAPVVAQATTPVQAPVASLAPSETASKAADEPGDKATVKRSTSNSHTQTKSYAPRPVKTAQAPVQQAPAYTPDYREPARVQAPAICYECGRVESVNAVQTQAAPSGVGMIAGGVVGGLLGNQVGGGNGKKLATVAGAVGGGFAGHEIEKRTRSATTYEVRVRMEDGRIRTFPYNNAPQWQAGDRIRVVDGYLQSRA